MIARLVGTLVEHFENTGIIDVQGVGYEVHAPERCLEVWAREGAKALVSTQVREDSITLFAFATADERKTFEVLLSVSGIGPKTALAVCDALLPADLMRAVEGDDVITLAKVPGIGKKTAQRLALELKGKVRPSFVPAPTGAPKKAAPEDPLPLALARLGYTKSEIDRALAGLADQGVDAQADVSVRLGASLKILSAR